MSPTDTHAIPSPVAARVERQLRAAFLAQEQDSIRLAMRVRAAALAVIAVWVMVQDPRLPTLYYEALIGAFVAAGLVQWRLLAAERYRRWYKYLFLTFDVALLTFTLLMPNPFEVVKIPPQLVLRFETFPYFFTLLGFAVVTFSPRLVLWAGANIAVIWSLGVLRIVALADTRIDLDRDPQGVLQWYLHPHYVDVVAWGQQVVLVLITAGILAAAVARAQRLVRTQVTVARERANLSRYFSPNMVDALARSEMPLDTVRSQNVAVLFADIVGFTAMADGRPPAEAIALLREYHRRMAAEVFAHDGTLDKYIGDGVMATFGTPAVGPHDAVDALACAVAMVDAAVAWSAERVAAGLGPVRIGVGVHYGPAVLGDIGDARRLEFAVIGDTVNLANRLERLTRSLGVAVVASEVLVAAVEAENPGGHPALAGFVPAAPQAVRGRAGMVEIRVLKGREEGA